MENAGIAAARKIAYKRFIGLRHSLNHARQPIRYLGLQKQPQSGMESCSHPKA